MLCLREVATLAMAVFALAAGQAVTGLHEILWVNNRSSTFDSSAVIYILQFRYAVYVYNE